MAGIQWPGLNGGQGLPLTAAYSHQIATDGQEQTNRYWNAIVGNGGHERTCGRGTDRWGVSRQIPARAPTDPLTLGGADARRTFEAVLTMQKIDVAAHGSDHHR